MKIPKITIHNAVAWCLPGGFIQRYEEVVSNNKELMDSYKIDKNELRRLIENTD